MNSTRKQLSGPKQRFAQIEERLRSNNYSNVTRKVNRNYLNSYLKSRSEEGTAAVEARKAQAKTYISQINAYKKKVAMAAPAAAPKPVAPAAPPKPPAPAATKSIVTSVTVAPKPIFELVDVSADGNCFYRSLYNAALSHQDPTVLDRVFTILGADKKQMGAEETGQKAIRAAVANYYRTQFLKRTGPYEALLSNFGNRQFKGWVREATRRQGDIYNRIKEYAKIKDGKAQFYKDLADVISIDKEYASDIDYMIISEILEKGGIRLISSNFEPKSSFLNGVPVLFIKRLSYEHYNFWRWIKPAALSVISNSSSNNESLNARRRELFETLDRRMDRHARCIEKCRALASRVEATKAEIAKLVT
jgi:hypothetical protein